MHIAFETGFGQMNYRNIPTIANRVRDPSASALGDGFSERNHHSK